MKIINCGGHEIKEMISNKTYPLTDESVRAWVETITDNHEDYINGAPIKSSSVKALHLPRPKENTTYIVSSLVVGMLEVLNINRSDIVTIGKTIRDGKNAIIGCQGFRRAHYNSDQPTIDVTINYIN